MITLYSYPPLFGVADNNGYGLKVFVFLKLAGVPFQHEHIFDASKAPRGQLPYIVDGGEPVGDSDTIIAHVIRKHGVTMDDGLTRAQRALAASAPFENVASTRRRTRSAASAGKLSVWFSAER